MIQHILAVIYGLAFIWLGIAHFKAPQKFVQIIPAFLPFPLLLVYLSGAMEIGGGLAIIYPETRVLADLDYNITTMESSVQSELFVNFWDLIGDQGMLRSNLTA